MTSSEYSNVSSRRGVAHEWKDSNAKDKIVLFGAGGHLDGNVTALISGNLPHNQQVEEAMSMTGMGKEGSIDVLKQPINNYNSNNEFNFSSYKRGPTRAGDYYVAFGSELASGDADANILNPFANSVEDTVKALGVVSEGIWGAAFYGDDQLLKREGMNPFMAVKPIETTQTQKNMDTSMEFYDGGGDGEVRDIIPDDVNADNGLRRKYIKKNSSVLKERLSQKESMMTTYNDVLSSYADMEHGGSDEREKQDTEREEVLARVRFDGSKYLASQAGLSKVSNDYSKKNKKRTVNRFSSTQIGV